MQCIWRNLFRSFSFRRLLSQPHVLWQYSIISKSAKMSLLLHTIVTYIKENIITKLQTLYSLPRSTRVGNKSPTLFVKKPLCTGSLSPTRKMFIERPVHSWQYSTSNTPTLVKPVISVLAPVMSFNVAIQIISCVDIQHFLSTKDQGHQP